MEWTLGARDEAAGIEPMLRVEAALDLAHQIEARGVGARFPAGPGQVVTVGRVGLEPTTEGL